LLVIGESWRKLLKFSDQELGIDSEYTHPGIEALLLDLEKRLHSVERDEEYVFPWNA
jgi:hypothetical protein